jgi:uncharacterized protein YdeI (YjbR/CyaY-like superfamily)
MDVMETYKNIPVVRFRKLQEWIDWLEFYHDEQPQGVWMLLAKKNSGTWGLNYEEAREGALLYGWIDSVANKFDEKLYYVKITPRRPKSVWSKINVSLVEQYIAEGRMHSAGLIEVENAKTDGRWDRAY